MNNHFDIEFFRLLATNPPVAANHTLIRQIVKHPLFDCIGHSYQVAYGNIILILATTLDVNLDIFPDPRGWVTEFATLRTRKEKGYYWGSDVSITPIGAYHIFEGQARFAQLQFLHFATGGKLGWDDIWSKGMLKGIYGEAFQTFLHLAETGVAATHRSSGRRAFPVGLRHRNESRRRLSHASADFQNIHRNVDPGIRFFFLCRTIAQRRPDLARAIQQYSRAEYTEVSGALTGPLLVDSPLAIAETVTRWVSRSKTLDSLMAEHLSFDFAPVNLPVHFVFSHFLAFSKDKYLKLELFRWPGAWMTGERASPKSTGCLITNQRRLWTKPRMGEFIPVL